MRLTALGTGTISLTPGRACAGYLVEAGPVRLLLDAGSGVAHRLAELRIDWMAISHLALTHFHTDHIGDLPTLLFAMKYGRLPGRDTPLTLLGPVGTAVLVDRLAEAHGSWMRELGFPLTVQELDPESTTVLAENVVLRSTKVPHTPESVAYSVERGGCRLVYTGDTGYDPALGAWAAGCDLLLCECSLPATMAIPVHLTPEQCALVAEQARPGRLVLTHLYPPVEVLDLPGIIATRWTGPVSVATDGWTIEIEEH